MFQGHGVGWISYKGLKYMLKDMGRKREGTLRRHEPPPCRHEPPRPPSCKSFRFAVNKPTGHAVDFI